jgi:hypothetical protein
MISGEVFFATFAFITLEADFDDAIGDGPSGLEIIVIIDIKHTS